MKTHKIIYLFIILFTMGLFSQVSGQELPDKLVLDLQGAVDQALAFNKSLKNSRLEVDRARKRNWEAISQGLPQVDGALDYMTYFNYELEFNFSMGDVSDFTPDQLQEAFNQTQAQFPFYTMNDLACLLYTSDAADDL